MLGAAGDPEATLAVRGSLRLAFVAAIQFLPARQRAVLILRDVLAFSALEVADILDSTPAAVNSSLQRARARLAELDATEDCVEVPADPPSRALVDEYIEAFERADVEALTRLLADQVVLEMPPVPCGSSDASTMPPSSPGSSGSAARTGACCPPSPTASRRSPHTPATPRAPYGAHSLQVLSLAAGQISRNVVFQNPGLFTLFGLPLTR